ncbi:MAG: NAD(P)-binding domain-containing protein [Alphaproteobacteria bacterium]|nr:NAD(P)-binding domain-containing protein [Alphaproteobacteria bacterium]MCB9698102.1 NAD(P)-binding domain-containing protein [Alphaproteobacteria bacterium]
MRTTILGSGNMARGVGTRLVAGGNAVTLHGRDTARAAALAAELGADATTDLDAALSADVIVLALPYQAALALAWELSGRLAGKIVVDLSNPLNATYDGLVTSPSTSAAEQIAAAAPEARVVKAFNTTFAGTLVAGEVGGQPLDVFVASDDDEARAKVLGLVQSGGLIAIDAGPLHRARQLEALALLGITLQFRLDTGFGTAWKLVRP